MCGRGGGREGGGRKGEGGMEGGRRDGRSVPLLAILFLQDKYLQDALLSSDGVAKAQGLMKMFAVSVTSHNPPPLSDTYMLSSPPPPLPLSPAGL